MAQLKFNKEGKLIPQKISYDVKHNERDKEFIDEYVKDECNFEIKYNNKGDFKFIKKNKKTTKEDEINEMV